MYSATSGWPIVVKDSPIGSGKWRSKIKYQYNCRFLATDRALDRALEKFPISLVAQAAAEGLDARELVGRLAVNANLDHHYVKTVEI